MPLPSDRKRRPRALFELSKCAHKASCNSNPGDTPKGNAERFQIVNIRWEFVNLTALIFGCWSEQLNFLFLRKTTPLPRLIVVRFLLEQKLPRPIF